MRSPSCTIWLWLLTTCATCSRATRSCPSRLTSGDHYDIRDPLAAALMKSRLFIALPRSDRPVYVPYLHIAALETLENGLQSQQRAEFVHG